MTFAKLNSIFPLRVLRNSDDYWVAVAMWDDYMECFEPKPGSSGARYKDLLALVIKDYIIRKGITDHGKS